MNDALRGLGEFLAGTYLQKLDEWSALGFSLTAGNHPESFDLADDILRIEGELQLCTEIVSTFQTDFVPQDLLSISNSNTIDETSPSVEQLDRPASRVFKRELYYPFPIGEAPNFNGLLNNSSPSMMQRSVERAATGNARPFISDRIAKTGASELSQPPKTIRKNPSEKISLRAFPPGNTSLEDSSAKALLSLPVDETEHKPKSPEFRRDSIAGDAPDINVAQQPSATVMADEDNASSGSIWSQQLRNLGDFASVLTYPSPAGTENAEPPQRSKASPLYPDQLVTKDALALPVELANSTTIQRLHIPEQLIANSQKAGFATPQAVTGSEALPQHKHATNARTESHPFPSEFQQQVPSSDPDELLEALTERILRDFRRYYP